MMLLKKTVAMEEDSDIAEGLDKGQRHRFSSLKCPLVCWSDLMASIQFIEIKIVFFIDFLMASCHPDSSR